MREHRSRLIVVAGAIAAVVAFAACSSPPAERGRLEQQLDEQAVSAAGDAGFISQSTGLEAPADGIAEYARRIGSHLSGTGVEPEQGSGWMPGSPDHADPFVLVGIEPYDDSSWQEPVGALVLGSRLTEASVEGAPQRDYCVRLEFDRWGFVDGGATTVDCPGPLVAVAPPADARAVIPEQAESVAIAVLAASADAPADEIAAAIAAQLPQAADGPPIAEVQVTRDGDRVGLAMRDAHDCLLVRSANGVAERLYVPDILLQPGELGCTAETALMPDEAFASPH
ncbi:hypothetical protein ASE14_11375 [Agromyces sp. Root81]|uniref:hypothetical protein n=1 Tax=Agromyces sp. Root81 TaxID=1736601 RepID=UPI0006F27988|nr:hypothetical protein [Agromyces sp. Root81]KRC61460.1 hypothetical protein ASE14_11375 [Agromyces sp. Root81]